MDEHTTAIEVRYAETDASGIVWHGSYIAWLEAARTAFIRDLGLPYPDLVAAGFGFVVSELSLNYKRPAVYGDVVLIHTRLTRLQSRKMTLDYRLTRQSTGEPLSTARTVLIFVTGNGTATSIPPEWRALFSAQPSG